MADSARDAAGRGDAYRLEVIDRPAALSDARAEELTEAFVRLGWRSTGGEDWRRFRPAREGWERYYRELEGTRVRDYARIGLVWCGDELVHMSGVSLREVGGDAFVVFRVTHTHPRHRRAGLLVRVGIELTNDWLHRLASDGRRVWILFRTISPIVYEGVRKIFSFYRPKGVVKVTLHPDILEDGSLAPIPSEVREVTERAAAATSPGFRFQADSFVLEGIFAPQYHVPVFADLAFEDAPPGPRRFFDTRLDRKRQDGLVTLVGFDFAPPAASR